MFAICTVARCRRRQEEVCTQWQIQKIVLGRGRRGSGGLDPTFKNIFGPLTPIAPHGSATVCPLPLLPSYWKGLGVFGIGRNAERKMRDPLRWLSAGFIRAESYTCCLTESRSVCGVQSGGRLGTTTATTFSWSPCGADLSEQTHTHWERYGRRQRAWWWTASGPRLRWVNSTCLRLRRFVGPVNVQKDDSF